MSETTRISRSEIQTSWIPVSVAARSLKVSRQRVYQLVGEGLLSGRKVDRTWLISHRSVEARVALLRSEVKMMIVERPKGMDTRGV